MRRFFLYVALLITGVECLGQVFLSHNIGNEVIQTSMYTCSNSGVRWARDFWLQDFGIQENEAILVSSCSIGVADVNSWGVTLQFNIYSIDENFPASFPNATLIGSTHAQQVLQFSIAQIITIPFYSQVVIPAGTQRILVEVEQESLSTMGSIAFPAGTAEDSNYSWFRPDAPGCGAQTYLNTEQLNVPDARFFITLSGSVTALDIKSDNKNPVSLIPNPVIDILYFTYNEEIEAVKIFNALGQLVDSINGNESEKIVSFDMSRFTAGLYFFVLHNEGWEIQRIKVIKN